MARMNLSRNFDGTVGTITQCRRLKKSSGTFSNGTTNYIFEGYDDCIGSSPTFGEVDPDAYSGKGSWTQSDGGPGMVYIPGSLSGWISTATVSIGHTWYNTPSCTNYLRTAEEIMSGGGPLSCPRHVATRPVYAASPGPNSTKMTGVMMIFNEADMGASPDYSIQPADAIYAEDFSANLKLAPNTESVEGAFRGGYFHPASRKLFVFAPKAINGTHESLIHVFQIGGSPVPAPVEHQMPFKAPVPLSERGTMAAGAGLSALAAAFLLRSRASSV